MPLDMVFSDNNLYMATFHPDAKPTIDEIIGNFHGDIAGVFVPEPASLAALTFCLAALTRRRL